MAIATYVSEAHGFGVTYDDARFACIDNPEDPRLAAARSFADNTGSIPAKGTLLTFLRRLASRHRHASISSTVQLGSSPKGERALSPAQRSAA